eukprot:5115034-Pleurochrysis_carterae.AAC.1
MLSAPAHIGTSNCSVTTRAHARTPVGLLLSSPLLSLDVPGEPSAVDAVVRDAADARPAPDAAQRTHRR